MAYTDPEVAWMGINEIEAKAQNIEYGKVPIPLGGRSSLANRDEGFTKLLFDKQTHRLIGAGIVGTIAGDLIAEVGLAIEMGADAATWLDLMPIRRCRKPSRSPPKHLRVL